MMTEVLTERSDGAFRPDPCQSCTRHFFESQQIDGGGSCFSNINQRGLNDLSVGDVPQLEVTSKIFKDEGFLVTRI